LLIGLNGTDPNARHWATAVTRWVLVAGDFVLHGGMDRANYALAAFLARAGERVELVTHHADAGLTALPGVVVHRVARPLGWQVLGDRWIAMAGRWHAQAAGARIVVNGGNCPVPAANWMHYVHAAHSPELPASRLRRWKSRLTRPVDLRAERAATRLARVVICNSERTRRDVIEHLGVAPECAVTIYLGCDGAVFRPAAAGVRKRLREELGWPVGRPVVLFVGALGDRRKGFDTLFAAWQLLCREPTWDALLAVVGRGAEAPLWKRRAVDAGLTDRIRFLGFRTDVPDLARAADVLAHPARYEAYGLGVHEALCCGMPAIVSASAGVAERYPADLADLLLADPEDASELVDRLRHWRANSTAFSERVRPLSDGLRARTWDDMARDIRDTIMAANSSL
jgi:glycosyltransferase involved in cell wall biosynthesis